MSKVLVMPGVVIGRSFKTPVSPDPAAAPEVLAAAPVQDVLLTVAPGADAIKTGEIRFHVPELEADEFLRDTNVDIIIAHAGHMTDTATALQEMEDKVTAAEQAKAALDAENNQLSQELVQAQDHATSLGNQLEQMTTRAETAEATVTERDKTIEALQKQLTDLQQAQNTPVPEGTATVVDDKVPEPKSPAPTGTTTPATPATPATPTAQGQGSGS